VQVDPIQHQLKLPKTKCLKLKFDYLLSNVAFKFNVRRYKLAELKTSVADDLAAAGAAAATHAQALRSEVTGEVAAEVTARGAAVEELRGMISDGMGSAAGAYTRPLLSST